MREVHIALKNMGRREHNEFAMHASLSGVKIPLKLNDSVTSKDTPRFDDEESKKADAAIKRAIERHANMRRR